MLGLSPDILQNSNWVIRITCIKQRILKSSFFDQWELSKNRSLVVSYNGDGCTNVPTLELGDEGRDLIIIKIIILIITFMIIQ